MNNSEKIITDDILYHLDIMLADIERLKIDYNRDSVIQYVTDSLSRKVLTVIQLYERYDKPVFRALKNKVNGSIATNPNLKGFIICIDNTRFESNNGIIEKFKIEI